MKAYSLTHWNVNEMRTTELADEGNERMAHIAQTLLMVNGGIPDFASFNELEYDIPGVPTKEYQTRGENISRLFQRMHGQEGYFAFAPGNCGMDGRAHPMGNGEYYNVRNARSVQKLLYGDLMNCIACLPAQYGVGFWSRHPIEKVRTVSKLLWREFKPDVELRGYALPARKEGGRQSPVPQAITLFDKSVMIVTVPLGENRVHFVVTHLVPAFGFGNPKSDAIERNSDQVAFLEWLMTGKTDFDPVGIYDDEGAVLHPFSSSDRVILMGDLNVDFRANVPGAERLRRLMNDQTFPRGKTTEVSGTKELQLDYLIPRNILLHSTKIGPIDPDQLSDHAALRACFSL